MMNIQKLKQDRVDAFNSAEALVKAAEANGGVMSAEQLGQYEGFKATIKNLDANIAVAQERLDAERAAPAVAQLGAIVGKNNAEDKKFASLGEQLVAIVKFNKSNGHVRDPRLFASPTGQNETIDAEGGFLVQEDFAPELLTRTFEDDEILKRCDTVPVSSSRLVMNGVVDDNRKGGPAGMGVLVYRVAEAQGFNFSTIKFRRVELNMNKLIGGYKATDELLEDAAALQSQVNNLFPTAFSWRMANEVLNGTGAGQFLGINTSGVVVVAPKDANQIAGTITTSNVLKMKSLLWTRSRKNAVWLVGPDVEAVLETLTIPGPTGTAGALYIAAGVNGNKYAMLQGMPVIPVEQTAALGTQGDIMLVDLSQYVIGERNGSEPKFASSIHVAFMTDEQVFRWTLRNDGQPYWDKPVTQNNSVNMVSPFVVLQSRM
jgi:HK97 family phage major capsid protein